MNFMVLVYTANIEKINLETATRDAEAHAQVSLG